MMVMVVVVNMVVVMVVVIVVMIMEVEMVVVVVVAMEMAMMMIMAMMTDVAYLILSMRERYECNSRILISTKNTNGEVVLHSITYQTLGK